MLECSILDRRPQLARRFTVDSIKSQGKKFTSVFDGNPTVKWWFVGRRRWNASNGLYIYIYMYVYIYINQGQYIASEPGRERQFCRVLGPQHRFTPRLKNPQRSDQSLPEITSFRQFQLRRGFNHSPAWLPLDDWWLELRRWEELRVPWGFGADDGWCAVAAIYPRWVMISSGTIYSQYNYGEYHTPYERGNPIN